MLIAFNKPWGVLCQFTAQSGKPTLADHIDVRGVYAAGRLDLDSEGLLLLTDEGRLQHRIAHPDAKLIKTYWVQVEGTPSEAVLQRLRGGVQLKDGRTLPAEARTMAQPSGLWPRDPPIGNLDLNRLKLAPGTWRQVNSVPLNEICC